MRRISFGALLFGALGVFLSGCFLLSPDARDDDFALRIVVRSDPDAAAKAPCADPFTLLAESAEGELSARAMLFVNSDCTRDELPELVATIPLTVGDFVDGGRELTGTFEFDLGPKGSCYSVDVELRHLGVDRMRDLSGEWDGRIVLEGDLVVNVVSLQLARESVSGPSSTFGGTILLQHESIVEQTSAVGVTVTHDARDASVEGSYLTAPVDFFGDGVRRPIRVNMDGFVQPATIFAVTSFDLGELVPGDASNAPAEVVLQPTDPFATAGQVYIDTTIQGAVTVQFEGGDPANPRATGTVVLDRNDAQPGCD